MTRRTLTPPADAEYQALLEHCAQCYSCRDQAREAVSPSRGTAPTVVGGTARGHLYGRRLMKICGRCDQPIRAGEPHSEHPIDAPSQGGTTVYRHLRGCRRVPTQTTQASLRH
jgi:hypothetical protein